MSDYSGSSFTVSDLSLCMQSRQLHVLVTHTSRYTETQVIKRWATACAWHVEKVMSVR